MSSIPTKKIDGDVAVVRNVSTGGDANIQGNARIGHDLVVEGWLEAKNIKSVNKGLFATVKNLRETYPQPHDGWFAGVSATEKEIADLGLTVQQGKALYRMYVGAGGDWVCEPINKLYEIVVDNTQVNNLQEEFDKVSSEVNTLKGKVDNQDTEIKNLKVQQTTIGNSVNQISKDVDSLGASIVTLSDKIAKPGGIAPLDEEGLVPAEYLPEAESEHVEFDGFLDIAPAGFEMSSVSSGTIYFVRPTASFVCRSSFGKFHKWWLGVGQYGTLNENGITPAPGKLYVDRQDNLIYRWDGETLVPMGSALTLGETDDSAYPGNKGKQLREDVDAIKQALSKKADSTKLDEVDKAAKLRDAGTGIMPFDGVFEQSSPDGSLNAVPKSGVWWNSTKNAFLFMSSPFGFTAEDYTADGKPRTDRLFRFGNSLYHIANGKLKELGGSADGNCLNVTVELPKQGSLNPYYDLESATARIFDAGRTKLGLQITFAATASSWKQYQYIGSSTDKETFCNPDNWIDMAGTSAGKESVVNINDLCGNPTGADYYSFESAIDALAQLESETKVLYRKAGMIITYRISDSEWETLQLVQKVTDFGTRAAWVETGGNNAVETKDTPAAGGKDAFSTGGAYHSLPAQHLVSQEDGTVSIQLLNAAGEPVMEPITFLAATGGGGDVSGTVVTIKFEKSPLFGALGSEISTKAAIRSITMAGANEVDNAIATLELIDRDTNLTVWSENVNKPSSASMDDYSFPIDFTSFLAEAGQRRFTLRATDEAGYSTTKFITVTAEDITVSVAEVQVLNVRDDAMITTGMERATVDLFKFANNQSDKGIEAVVDILLNGSWQELHRSIVTDSFTKSVSFSPAGLGLTHGAYPIRISGTSRNSGVTGNTVYSAIMVVDPEATTPIVAIRYDSRSGGMVKLYESVSFDIAVYNPLGNNTIINTKANDSLISQLLCDNSHTYNVTKQIQGFADGELINIYAKVVSATDLRDFRSYEVPVKVSGSVIDAALKDGALYSFDFSSRTNSEADHSIADGDYAMTLNGANYTSNGFVNYLGQNCLRIAENVTGSLNHMPFAAASLEAAGMAWQCQFATNNIKDPDSKLLECYDPTSGAGFYIKGNKVGIYCRNGNQPLEERSFKCGEQITVGFVVEPSNTYVERAGVKYSALRMYLNGELVAHIGYIPGRGDLFNGKNITVNGTSGDLYLYYMLAYQSHYEWAQAFKNHLVKLQNTDAMIEEFNKEDVLVSQTAEGVTAMRPSAAALWARGIPYVVLVADDDTFNTFDSGTSTSDNFEMTVFYYDPVRPWRSFKATNCRIRRQGTTSAKRCKKNVRIYLSKASEIIPLFPDYTNDDALLTYTLFAKKKIRVGEKTIAIDLTTIKIDYSDAGGANDCGVCDMMNVTYRALGNDYMTPAQRFFNGTQDIDDIHLEGLELNHSTANHPIAVFRSTSDTLQNVYFEAKGNWKEDKGEQTALGFKDTPGYNLGCINYQDDSFTEYYGLPNETLDQTETRFRADKTVDTSKLYLLSQYCGNRYRFLKYVDGAWTVMAGSMKQTGGKGTNTWKVDGYVLNPVTGFELLTYQELDWWRGVDALDTMMQTGSGKISSWVQKLIDKGMVTADVVPLWTYYFECMVDNDDLAIAYATGKKVPFELYRMLRYCDSIDPDKHPDTFAANARQNFFKYLNVRSKMVYYAATDYNSLYDQQAKNGQPMFFLEDGCSIVNGVYYNAFGEEDTAADVAGPTVEPPARMLPVRMYLNKVYDADGANGKDNDGGCTGDPECDPGKPTDEETGYANPYAGWNSILWVVLRQVQEYIVDDAGNKTDLRTVVAAMRSVEAVVDGRNMKPFSPEGATYFFIEKRLKIWPKVVSSYDGIRKYVQYTATSDTIYFYALQGLGLTSLPDFIEKRWRIRDGYYQTGAFFTGYISARIACPEGAKIRFTAGKTGYYGIGNDNTGSVTEAVYLEAGQSHEFTNFSHQTGALIYIYQADRMSALDLSEISLGSSNGEVDFTVMTLVVSLMLGSATHTEQPTGYQPMTSAKLGNLPFLETLDIRRTGLKSIDTSGCPRLRKLDASDSAVETFTVARTSPINDIAMPDTLTEITLAGLPNLTYIGLNAPSGLRVPALPKVQKLRMETSPNLNARRLLKDALECQEQTPALSSLRISGMPLKGDASELQAVVARGVAGLDSDGNRCARPVVNADYQLTRILDTSEISRLENAIDGLTLTTVVEAFTDAIDQVNGEYYSGTPEVSTVTLDNIADHLLYYNGETAAQALARQLEADRDIHQLINL
ncbi:MAG: hypothetical protein HDR99_05645 [Bacteroides sp.]|nr:hypothetical protein [Bacteroides sp.]